MGLDLGQAADYTAVAVLERLEMEAAKKEVACHIRHLQRYPLRTTYPDIVSNVVAMLQRPPLRGECELVVDATGVGAPVVDLLKQAGAHPRAVTITGGVTQSLDGHGGWHVPKRDLVSAVQVLLHGGRLRCAKGLPEWPVLERELLNFQVTINIDTTADTYGAWRERTHDDLVLAVALACWRAANWKAPRQAVSYRA